MTDTRERCLRVCAVGQARRLATSSAMRRRSRHRHCAYIDNQSRAFRVYVVYSVRFHLHVRTCVVAVSNSLVVVRGSNRLWIAHDAALARVDARWTSVGIYVLADALASALIAFDCTTHLLHSLRLFARTRMLTVSILPYSSLTV